MMPRVYLHEYCIIIERHHLMNFQVFASDSFFPHLHKSQLAQESVWLPQWNLLKGFLTEIDVLGTKLRF